MTLKQKIETALLAYLQPLTEPGQPLYGVPVISGHTNGKRRLPCVIIYAERPAPNDAFPPGTGVYDIPVKAYILTQADDEDAAVQDARVEAVQNRLNDTDALRMALNAPTANPLVPDLYLYDLIENAAEEGRDERHFGDVLNYAAIIQSFSSSL